MGVVQRLSRKSTGGHDRKIESFGQPGYSVFQLEFASLQPFLTCFIFLQIFKVALLDHRVHIFLSIDLFLLLVDPYLYSLFNPFFTYLLPHPLPLLFLVDLP